MRTILVTIGLALSAIVLSSTILAEEQVICHEKIQYHTANYNTTDLDTNYKFNWYFILTSDSTATLTNPGKFYNLEPTDSGFAYDSAALHGFPGWIGTYNQAMYNCWSEVIDNYYKDDKFKELKIARFFTALEIPDTFHLEGKVYTVTEIGDSAFYGSYIKYINVPENVNRIGDYAFANCSIVGLCEASPYQVIPNSVTEIGKGIFKNCKNLERIEFGNSVKTIPEETFDGCFYTDSASKDSVFEIKFGKNVRNIYCNIEKPNDLPNGAPTPYICVAFSSDKFNNTQQFDVDEVWIPTGNTTIKNNESAFTNLPDSICYDYYIKPEKNIYYMYSDQWLKLNFTQKSYFESPNAVYNYIYYYPIENGGINYTVNAVTGRGANKVRFRMIFDKLDSISQANEVYQMLNYNQGIATSYSYIKYKSAGEYNVIIESLDFTRAQDSVKIYVFDGVPATRIQLTGISDMTVGQSAQINHLAVNANGIESTVQDVRWSSSDSAIATVDERGIVTALSPGKVSITATSLDKCCPNAKGEFNITVSAAENTPAMPLTDGIAIESNISVSASGRQLTVSSNAPLGKIDIYSFDGRLVKSLNSTMNTATVSLPSNGLYIVKTPTKSIKVSL